MNLLLNARDALLAHEMAEPRRIAIAARREGGNVGGSARMRAFERCAPRPNPPSRRA